MSSESSTHQLVGFVTKMFPTFGYINNEIFFQRKCVIGPMVEVGDHVATSAVYQPNMPIKWSAEKVWRVQGDTRTRTKDNEEKKHWHERSPRRKSPSDKREHLASRDRDVRPFRESEAVVRPERKRREPSVGKRSTSRSRPDEKVEQKRRRVSPTTSVSNRSTRGPEEVVPKRHGDKYLLNTKDLIVPDIHTRYSSLLAPVDLYRVVCHWQDSFPLLRPFQCSRSVVFQTITPPDLPEPSPPSSKDTGFYVNVLLLSMPSTTSLHDKTIIRAESLDREKPPIRKYIKILAVAKPKQRFKAIGGPWIPELDGAEPVTDPRTLINSAIRICKDQVGLDLSFCTRWNRFLEFRYSRTEGSTARPTSVLFPGSQLWGRSFPDAPSTKSNGPVKPYHRIVVYFIPDIWTVMPTAENWNNVKNAFECAFSGSNSRFFPLSPAEIDGYLKKGVASAEETPSGATAKSETPCQISSTATTDTEVVAQMEQPTGSSEPEKCDQSVTESVQNASSTSLLMDSSQLNEEVMQSPSASSSAKDKESADPEINDVTKIIKKSHDELNLSSMKVSELREQLKARNLPADGIKAQLLSRLKTAIEKEAEQARKLEEERKQKEKAAEEAAAKAAEEKKKETAKTEPVATVPSPASAVKISLKNYPSIVIQHKFPRDYTLQTVSLDTILESKVEVIDARSYEMILCVHSLLDMIRRDAVFTLFRALVTAGDRGVQAKPRPKSEIKPTRTEPRDRPTDVKDAAKPPAYQTIDVPLLSACTFLDPNARGYFSSDEVEEMFTYLGLPISRYQVRSLISKVADAHRIYYRTLTDSEVSPLTVKSTLMYSEIDDDEYLLELIRGGDAILDEQKDAVSPIGGYVWFVLHISLNHDYVISRPVRYVVFRLRCSNEGTSRKYYECLPFSLLYL
ncbi:unnamed protein product [Dicrocoelium dendriticum]|nr:unnamed protein product [Dicrocoelium dendriticum]